MPAQLGMCSPRPAIAVEHVILAVNRQEGEPGRGWDMRAAAAAVGSEQAAA